MSTPHAATIINATPCPFCGGRDLTINQWHGEFEGHGDAGEIDAIECNTCLAAAPCSVWNKRPQTDTHNTDNRHE